MRNIALSLVLAASILISPAAFAAGVAPVGETKPQSLTAIYQTCADGTGLVTGYKITNYDIVGGKTVARSSRVDFTGKTALAIAKSFWCKYYSAKLTPELIDGGLVYPTTAE